MKLKNYKINRLHIHIDNSNNSNSNSFSKFLVLHFKSNSNNDSYIIFNLSKGIFLEELVNLLK